MWDWIEETWDAVVGGADAFLAAVGTNAADLYESLSGTFDTNTSPSGADYADMSIGQAMGTKMATSNEPSLVDRMGGYYKKNKGLVDLVGSGIAAYQQNENKQEAAAKLAESRLNELREADRIKQANNARFSASVSGLRPVGLINSQQKLRRVGGANVFNNTGGLIRG